MRWIKTSSRRRKKAKRRGRDAELSSDFYEDKMATNKDGGNGSEDFMWK